MTPKQRLRLLAKLRTAAARDYTNDAGSRVNYCDGFTDGWNARHEADRREVNDRERAMKALRIKWRAEHPFPLRREIVAKAGK